MALVVRPPNRMIGEKQAQEKREIEQLNNGSPRPISSIGGGRGGSLIAFTEGIGKVR